MLDRIVFFSRSRRVLIGVIAVAALVFSVVQLDESRVETLPEFSPPFVEVQTEALGLSAYEVEQLITVPLEADLLNGVAFVESITSQSMPGLSSILMTFEPGTDVLDARQLVQERLTQAAGLPNVSRAPAMVQPLSSESRIMMIGVSSEELSLVELGVLARWTIRPRLLSLDGVANVVVWGQRRQQLQVQVDPAVLEENGVPLIDVVETTGNALWVTPLSFLEASTPGVGGFIEGPNQRIGIRHVPAISAPEDLESVAVEGRPDLVLGDLATVVVDHQPLIGNAVVDGKPGMYLVVERFPWSNTAKTTRAVEAALADLEPGLDGVELDADVFRPATYLERAVDNLQLVGLAALALVALVLVLASGSWRRSLVTLLSLLVTLSLSGLVLYFADVAMNSMLLLGFAVGAIIILGSLARYVHHLARDVGPGAEASAAAHASTSSGGYLVAILGVAFIPALIMEGTAGAFVPEIGKGVMLTLLLGLVVGVLVTPVLASVLLPVHEANADESSTLSERAAARYTPFLNGFGMSVRNVGIVAVLVLAVGIGSLAAIDNTFAPEFRQTDLVVGFEAAGAVSLSANSRIAGDMAQELAALPGVLGAGAHVGRAVLSDEVSNVNSASVWLSMDPDADYDETFLAVRQVVDGYPGIGRPAISTYSNDRVNDRLRTESNDLVVRVYGEEPIELASLTQDLVGLVDGVAGVENVRALFPATQPTVEIEVDLQKAAAALVKPGDVRRAAATLLSGIEVGSLFEDQKVFEVVVWSPPEVRDSVTSVENLLVDTPTGDKIRVADVATVAVVPNQRVIQRDAVSRYIDIVADVPSRSIASTQDDIAAAIEERGLPFEYHVGFPALERAASGDQRQFIIVAIAAALTVLLLLQAALSSFRLAALVAGCVMLSLSGSFVAAAVVGDGFSVGTFAGLIAVAGLTLQGCLALLKHYEAEQLDDGAELGSDLVSRGARRNFGPSLIGLVSVAAATVPVLILGVEAGTEVLHPFSVAVLGGTITSAAAGLLLLPALYLRFARPAVAPELAVDASQGWGAPVRAAH